MRTMIAAALLLIAAKTLAQNEAAQVGADQQPSHAIQNDGNSDEIENRSEYCSFLFSPPVAETRCPESASDKQKIEDEGSEFWPVFGHRLKITDSLLVIFTFILAAYTIRLWSATRRLAEGSEKTAKAQLRAYVAPSEKSIEIDFLDGTIRANLGVRNFGQTPAHDVNIECGMVILPPPIAADISIALQLDRWNESAFPMHPGEVVPVSTKTRPFSVESKREISEGLKAIFVAGKVTYKDGFGDNQATAFLYWICGKEAMQAERLAVYRRGNKAT